MTPHSAGTSATSVAGGLAQLGDETARILRGSWPMSLINPEVRSKLTVRTGVQRHLAPERRARDFGQAPALPFQRGPAIRQTQGEWRAFALWAGLTNQSGGLDGAEIRVGRVDSEAPTWL